LIGADFLKFASVFCQEPEGARAKANEMSFVVKAKLGSRRRPATAAPIIPASLRIKSQTRPSHPKGRAAV
jgi:hypothetical protein